MKIAVVSASGRNGRLITKEALSRGHEVYAIVRDASKVADLGATKVIERDIMDITYDDIKDCEVVIDAFGAWAEELLPQHETTLRHLANILVNRPNRLLVIGGAGSLWTDNTHKELVLDAEWFPKSLYPLAYHMGEGLKELRKRTNVRWTYVSPACDFQAEGARTGSYKLGGDEVIYNSSGKSYISYADFAIVMVDEAENNKFMHQRITAVSESQ